jgi:predicted PurR-regulated permease PerM
MDPLSPDLSHYTRRVLVAAGIIAALLVLLFLLWHVLHAVLLIFAATLFAVFLDGLADWVRGSLPLSRGWALALVIAFCTVLLLLFGLLAGPRIGEQIVQLGQQMPEALARIKAYLAERAWGQALLGATPGLEQVLPSATGVLQQISGAFSTALGALINIAIILLIGFYIAVDPRLYVENMLRLLPPQHRQRGREVCQRLSHALHWWMVGRFSAMAVVSVLTWVGLWIIDMPLALALGLIAGLLSFVPYVGPIVSVIPAVLVGLADGGLLQAVHVTVVYGAVQFLEGNFITPIIQKYAVALPPAVLLMAQFLMGILVGLFGVLLATPLAVAVIVLIQMLYVEDVLGDSVEVLGEQQ